MAETSVASVITIPGVINHSICLFRQRLAGLGLLYQLNILKSHVEMGRGVPGALVWVLLLSCCWLWFVCPCCPLFEACDPRLVAWPPLGGGGSANRRPPRTHVTSIVGGARHVARPPQRSPPVDTHVGHPQGQSQESNSDLRHQCLIKKHHSQNRNFKILKNSPSQILFSVSNSITYQYFDWL